MCNDIFEFLKQDFKKQIHQCCIWYCSVNHLSSFRNGRPTSDYFKARAYLWKLPTQDIKNIAVMLMEKQEPVGLYKMLEKSREYVAEKQAIANQSKLELIKAQEQYDMDSALADFLR